MENYSQVPTADYNLLHHSLLESWPEFWKVYILSVKFTRQIYKSSHIMGFL